MKEQSKEVKKSGFARGRGKETLFRVASRNQINLISIADNKANMIIGINAILISVIMALFGSGISIGGTPFVNRLELIIPFSLLLLACLVSVVFAIMAAKPHIISIRKGHRVSKLFFDSFFQTSLDDYIIEMHEVLSSNEATYDQMIIDLYNNGLVLRRKYSLLDKAYRIFMVGFIASVISSFGALLV
ncbi:MAG: DUF5706 domain-containing protein [Saprospiraceae bacterium]|nr:DUF5706 domain-containing protein [Saprospiraceae bacterium]